MSLRLLSSVCLGFGLVSSLTYAYDAPAKPIDSLHAEVPSDWFRGRPSMPYYDVAIDYLDDPNMSAREKLYLADTLTPVDFKDSDVRAMIRSKEITCTPFTCNLKRERAMVIGYSPQEYARLKALVQASPVEPIKPSGAIKVIGMWRDKYPIYEFGKDGDSNITLESPTYSGSKVFLDPMEVVAALTPVDIADIKNGFGCVLLCYTYDDHVIIGYDPVAIAKFKRRLSAMSQLERDAFYSDIQRKHSKRLAENAMDRQVAKQAQEKQVWQASYSPPSTIDPRTASAIPLKVIREAITGSESIFNLTTWKELNTYVLNKDGESVHYIEYQAQWDIKRANIKYVNSGGGIDYHSPRIQSNGMVGMVKRGNNWYVVHTSTPALSSFKR